MSGWRPSTRPTRATSSGSGSVRSIQTVASGAGPPVGLASAERAASPSHSPILPPAQRAMWMWPLPARRPPPWARPTRPTRSTRAARAAGLLDEAGSEGGDGCIAVIFAIHCAAVRTILQPGVDDALRRRDIAALEGERRDDRHGHDDRGDEEDPDENRGGLARSPLLEGLNDQAIPERAVAQPLG